MPWLLAPLLANCGSRSDPYDTLQGAGEPSDVESSPGTTTFESQSARALEAARAVCDRAVACYGEPEASRYDCYIPMSHGAYLWTYPEQLGPKTVRCWQQLSETFSESVRARFECLVDRSVPFLECLEGCPNPADECYALFSEASCETDVALHTAFQRCLEDLD